MDNALQTLTIGLFQAGLIQVGVFNNQNIEKHIQLRLEMLPSYPRLLQLAAECIAARFIPNLNRLICTPEAMALGTSISLHSGLPLVWHTGVSGTPSRNFIGAYDIEHVSTLITLTTTRLTNAEFLTFKHDATSVGLQLGQWISLLDDSPSGNENSIGLISLTDAVQLAMEQNIIPSKLGEKALLSR